MSECVADIVFPPSPNWYLNNILCVAPDGCLVYGSSTNDISILTPIEQHNKQRFRLNIIHTAHKKRITCLAVCPNWDVTPYFISGSEDGIVKLWNKTTFTFSIAHNLHFEANEDVVGVTFVNEKEVISVGNMGVIVLWSTKQNTVKADNKVVKPYKPLCIALCPLKQNIIAIGTKQGVVLVMSVTDKFMILYKAHGHETEVTSLSWCPTSYCDPLEKIVAMKRHKVKTFRVRKLSNRKPDAGSKAGPNPTDSGLYQQSSGEEADESDIFDVNKDTANDECVQLSDSDCDKDKKNDAAESNLANHGEVDNLTEAFQEINVTTTECKDLEKNESFVQDCKKLLNFMNSKKVLKCENVSFLLDPDDSAFNESQINPADESDIFDIYEEPPFHEFGHSKYVSKGKNDGTIASAKLELKRDFLDECRKLENILKGKEEASLDDCQGNKSNETPEDTTCLDETANESVIEKSDIFDIYEEPPFHEFGHSKYVPEPFSAEGTEKIINETQSEESSDFLKECNRLKEKIITMKSDDKSSENESVSVLSNDVNKLQITNSDDSTTKVEESSETQMESREGNFFFLASACKNGKVCIWRWGGNLVSSGNVFGVKDDKFKKLGLPWSALFWPSSKLLLIASKGAQLLKCNFTSIFPRSKGFGFSVVHEEHIRGLYCISSSINVDMDSDWRSKPSAPLIWSAAQDRLLVAYSPDENKVVMKINTFAGFVTNIAASPIIPNRFGIAAGDGVVRVWELSSNLDENSGLGHMKIFWQNVQGKVQGCAWHPTKENLLAFGNTEGRVGLIDSNTQNAAKILPAGLPLGVMSLCWGPNDLLYVQGSGKLIMYDTKCIHQDPIDINVKILDREWLITSMTLTEEYFTIGSKEGGVALLKPEYPHETAAFTYTHRKRINSVCWHPSSVSGERSLSSFANLLAVSANAPNIVVLKLLSENDVSLEVYTEFSSHIGKVTSICWSPHHNGKLLSVSTDNSAQVYDVISKCPLHTLIGHSMSVLSCLWSPTDSNLVMTGGEDFSLRMWDLDKHPYQEIKLPGAKEKKKMKLASCENLKVATHINEKQVVSKSKQCTSPVVSHSEDVVLAQTIKKKAQKMVASQSALRLCWKQFKDTSSSVEGCRRLFNYHENGAKLDYGGGFDYLRIFGSQEDINELLNIEQEQLNERLCWTHWTLIGLLKGDLKGVLEKAKENKFLTPSLLSLAPNISNRFWKEMMSAYVSQLESTGIQIDEYMKNSHIPIYRSSVIFATGAIEEACDALMSEELYVDAYIAAKVRHNSELTKKCFDKLEDNYKTKNICNRLAECYIVSGKLMDAAVVLGSSQDEEHLALAAEIAKYAGNKPMAVCLTDHIQMNITNGGVTN